MWEKKKTSIENNFREGGKKGRERGGGTNIPKLRWGKYFKKGGG